MAAIPEAKAAPYRAPSKFASTASKAVRVGFPERA